MGFEIIWDIVVYKELTRSGGYENNSLLSIICGGVTGATVVTSTEERKYELDHYDGMVRHIRAPPPEQLQIAHLHVKSLQPIWRSGTRKFHLRAPDLRKCFRDLTTCPDGTRIISPRAMGATDTTCIIMYTSLG